VCSWPFLTWCTATNRMNVLSEDVRQAAEDGDLGSLRELLISGNVNNVNVYAQTTLHFAAKKGQTVCCSFVLEIGGDVNARAIDGSTPLYLASLNGRVEVTRVLLDAGATVDTPDKGGRTSLYHAIRYNRCNVAHLLIDRGASIKNVKLDDDVTGVPKWIYQIIASRSRSRTAAIALIGIHVYHRTTITGNNDINVLRLVGKHIWSSRMNDVWILPTVKVEAKKLKRRNLKRGKK
jgi:ankyrin repeat protein